MTKRFLFMLIPAFACMTFFYCFFTIMLVNKIDGKPLFNFYTLMAITAIAVILNFAFSYKTRSIAMIAITNAILAIVGIISVISFENNIEGAIAYVLVILILVAPILFCIYLSIEPLKANTMLIFTEASIVGTALFLLFQLGKYDFPKYLYVACIASLLANLFMLSSLRMSGNKNNKVAGTKILSRGVILAMACVLILLVGFVMVFLFVPVVRNPIIAAAAAVKNFLVFIATSIYNFFAFLVSLLPTGNYEGDLLLEEPAGGGEPGMAEIADAVGNMNGLFIVLGIIVAVVIIFVINKFRKVKIGRMSNIELISKEDDENFSLIDLLKSLFSKVMQRIAFIKMLIFNRNTYVGAFILLRYNDARRKEKVQKAETPTDFFNRMLEKLPADNTIYDDTEALFKNISDAINKKCFSREKEHGLLSMQKNEIILLKKIRKEFL